MNKFLIVVVLSLFAYSSNASYGGDLTYGGMSSFSDWASWSLDYSMCSYDEDCSNRMGRHWCCATTKCQTSGYSSTSRSCEMR